MKKTLEDIFSSRKDKKEKTKNQKTIIIDSREKNSLVPAFLKEKKANTRKEKLEIGDYQIEDLIIERKTRNDFINSLINKRLKDQIDNLKTTRNRLLLIEEDKEPEKVHKDEILEKAIFSIRVFDQIPVIMTKSEEHTAETLIKIAKRSRNQGTPHYKKTKKTLHEKKQYLLEAIPGIGPTQAKRLLEKKYTLKEIFTSKKEEIEEITNKKIAEEINRIIFSETKENTP